MTMIVVLVLSIIVMAAAGIHGVWECSSSSWPPNRTTIQDIIVLLVLFVALHSMWLDLMNRVAAQ